MEDKEKEIISESIKVSDILAKELAFWKKMFKWSCIISISFIFILLTACYVYVYNTETAIDLTQTEQSGVFNSNTEQISTNNNQSINTFSSDYTAEELNQLMEVIINGKNKENKNTNN